MSKHPMDDASFCSWLTFRWAKVYVDDTSYSHDPPADLNPEYHFKVLKREWKKQLQKENPSFFKALYSAFALRMVCDSAAFILDAVAQVGVGIMTGQLIEFLQDYDGEDIYIGFLYAIGISIGLVISLFTKHIAFVKAHLRSGLIKITVQKLINSKLLKLSHSVINSGGIGGRMINIMSMDTEIMEFMLLLNFLWLSPLAALLVSIAILIIIGPAGLFGILIIFLLVPIQTRINRLNNKLRVKIGMKGDRRVKETTEVIEGIRVLKMYGWEEAYAKRIADAREEEVKLNRWRICIRATNMTLYLVAQGLACLATFSAFLIFNEEISASQIFSVLSLFITAQFYLTVIFPFATELISSYKGSCKRLTDFLVEPESKSSHKPSNDSSVELKDVSAAYKLIEGEEPELVLKNVNVKFPANELSFVIGEVGSGKSSLLLTILGEINLTNGEIFRSNRISYVEQEPWIVSGTIKENIVLGREFNSEKFNRILDCTGLAEDIQTLYDGIDTLIGERGTNLSGGQKARLGLARGLYTEADTYLLDDPLSAVDVRVGRHIFEQCVLGFLAGKTRILVTHQVQFISPQYSVFKVEEGEIHPINEAEKIADDSEPHQELEPEKAGVGAGKENVDEDEKIESNFWTLIRYLWHGYSWMLFFFALLYPISTILYLAVPFWLAYWSDQDDKNDEIEYYITVLAYIVLALFVVGAIRNNMMAQSLQRASRNLHNLAINSITRFPSSYFDKNTTGKIMGKMSNDVMKMDEFIPWMTTDFLQVLFITSGSIIAVLIGNPFMIIFVIPLVLALYYFFRKGYKPSEYHYTMYNASKGPIYNHVAITASGIFAIRAFNLMSDFKRMFRETTLYSYNRFLAHQSGSRWMHFSNDFFGCFFLIIAVLLAVALVDFFDPVLLATSLSLLLIVALQLIWMMYQLSQNKTFMVSGVRMMRYVKEAREAELRNGEDFQFTKGSIQFKDVVLQYDNNEPALKNLSFKIKAGRKVGIVGRTGAGKSSIIVSLFRMVELSGGAIFIDGKDISKLGLHTLRKQMAVIPQTPFIFTASFRYNLDPFQEHTDDEIWRALRLAHLDEKAKSLDKQLDTELSPTLLSVGQKQLLCLARALLRRSKILVMDEATANVDNDTDKKIHKAINQHFRDSTILIIAHRLNTIIKCHTIVAMGEGKCKEVGRPRDLLEDPESYFYSMVMMTGDHAQELIRKAKKTNYEDEESLNSISIH